MIFIQRNLTQCIQQKKRDSFHETISLRRGDRIRTCGRLVPNQERYRAALHPAANHLFVCVCKGSAFI